MVLIMNWMITLSRAKHNLFPQLFFGGGGEGWGSVFRQCQIFSLAFGKAFDSLAEPLFTILGDNRYLVAVRKGIGDRQAYPKSSETSRPFEAHDSADIRPLLTASFEQVLNLLMERSGKFPMRSPLQIFEAHGVFIQAQFRLGLIGTYCQDQHHHSPSAIYTYFSGISIVMSRLDSLLTVNAIRMRSDGSTSCTIPLHSTITVLSGSASASSSSSDTTPPLFNR